MRTFAAGWFFGSLGILIIATFWLSSGSSSSDPTGVTSEELKALSVKLASIELNQESMLAFLDHRLSALPVIGPAPAVQLNAESFDLKPDIDKLDSHLSKIDEVLRNLLSWERGIRPDSIPDGYAYPKQVEMVDSIVRRLATDPQSVATDHFGWSPDAVYRRYGKPDLVNRDGSLIKWIYLYVWPSGKRQNLLIQFTDGVVTDVTEER